MLCSALLSLCQTAPSWESDVRPLLAEHCLACHGPDEAGRGAGLRLDEPEGLARVVRPRDPEGSELLARVTSEFDFDRMPPTGHGTPLDEAAIATLRRWIEAGAAWAPHWAYAPEREVAPPESAESSWIRGPIDRFVLSGLTAAGLAPAPEADAETLLRRLHLDLTGLPPTDAERRDYLADPRPDRYERRVDELLESVHFAERFARVWLDIARYADSNGYTIDGGRSIWPYRDWVVDSIHRDQPFDRFTLEQLAGDLLPNATRAQRIATGFHRNTPINEEGGADDEENRINAVLDRAHTTGAAWLGATLACAQCHTHKFDPITQREFFGLYAFFDSCADSGVDPEPSLLVPPTPEHEPRAAAFEARSAELGRAETRAAVEARAGFQIWQPERAWASNGTKLRPELDGSFTALGQNAFYSTYVLEGAVLPQHAGASVVRIEALPRRGLRGAGPGRSGNGNFVLQRVVVAVRADASPTTPWQSITAKTARANFEQDTTSEGGSRFAATSVLDPDGPGWAVKPEFGVPHALELELEQGLPSGAVELRVELVQEHGDRHTLGSFRVALGSVQEETNRALVTEEWRSAARAALDHAAQRPDMPTTLVLQERAVPRVTRRFERGSFLEPREVVEPGFPRALDHFDGNAAAAERRLNRLDLARWLVHPANALVRRVEVNRLWQHFFGRGLVATENDFGLRGERPSHPELLEWLARDFRLHGLSRKHVVRRIVTSATYRQASTFDAELAARDPYNVRLARQVPLRLEGEVLRDAMLVAADVLDRTVGGPPVQPPQPDGVFDFTQSAKTWNTSAGSARFRRSLYTRLWRTAPFPFYGTFDAPLANAACTRRDRSNSPLQALALANDPMVMELAAALGERILGEWSLDDRGKIERAFEWTLGRAARPAEVDVLVGLQERVADDRGLAAGWTAVARALFNLQEFRYRR